MLILIFNVAEMWVLKQFSWFLCLLGLFTTVKLLICFSCFWLIRLGWMCYAWLLLIMLDACVKCWWLVMLFWIGDVMMVLCGDMSLLCMFLWFFSQVVGLCFAGSSTWGGMRKEHVDDMHMMRERVWGLLQTWNFSPFVLIFLFIKN